MNALKIGATSFFNYTESSIPHYKNGKRLCFKREESPDINKETNAFRNFAFFEAYFSNYIEGTIFEIKEAKSIIQTEHQFPIRTKILTTF
ncbi:hypothetical protein [Flavobacterium soyangense]|uniref:hypothetical protein n=1 Tax=Flavobacterium soyangense TaxID=2023265 RepID=UPI001E3BC660|nr:hypothetical protein [Flavobacterium soyangense]